MMLRLFILVVLIFCIPTHNALSADAGFSWQHNPYATGYKLHYGKESRNYTQIIDVGNPENIDGRCQASVSDIPEGVLFYYAATAYTADEESDYSEEVSHIAPLSPPQEFTVTLDDSIVTIKIDGRNSP